MIASLYYWRWADNELPGKPMDVFSALMRGELHPALQPFDARPVLAEMESIVGMDADPGQWELCIVPVGRPGEAHYVSLTGPNQVVSKDLHYSLWKLLCPLNVTCFDENTGVLDHSFPPKLSELFGYQWEDAPVYDITVDELPFLLKRIRPRSPDPIAILQNRQTSFVQCKAKGRRFYVEWRENYDLCDQNKFNQWRAQDKKRLLALERPYESWPDVPPDKDPDMLTYSDTLRIFQAFLRGEPRSAKYHWMSIKHWKNICPKKHD
ncbi:MAG: hypothetical protein WCJ35_17055 [Planctomycetota bacterium]